MTSMCGLSAHLECTIVSEPCSAPSVTEFNLLHLGSGVDGICLIDRGIVPWLHSSCFKVGGLLEIPFVADPCYRCFKRASMK